MNSNRNKNIICFSGGKDSTALILWAKENIKDFTTIFCDTGWEHETTYNYIQYINLNLLNNELVVLKSDKYSGFIDLVTRKKRFPDSTTRFCTQELKIKPTKKFIDRFKPVDVNLYVGIRADESPRRARMTETYFDEYYDCNVHRPLLKWNVDNVFDIIRKNGIKPNPLYSTGSKRVGCYPCIMTNHTEMKTIIKNIEIIEKINDLEKIINNSFFSVGYIPDWVCTGLSKNGKRFPWINDVVKYLAGDTNQIEMFEYPTCMSFYGLCE